jgi:hypothetical protein
LDPRPHFWAVLVAHPLNMVRLTMQNAEIFAAGRRAPALLTAPLSNRGAAPSDG